MANDVKLNVGLDISQIQGQAKQISDIIGRLNLSESLRKQFTDAFGSLESNLTKYQSKFSQGFVSKSDVTGFEKIGKAISTDADLIDKLFRKLQDNINKMSTEELAKMFKLNPKDTEAIGKIDQRVKELNEQIKSLDLKNLEQLQDLINSSNFKTKSGKTFISEISESVKSGDLQKANQLIDDYIKKQETAAKGTKTKISTTTDPKELETLNKTLETINANKAAAEEMRTALVNVASGTIPLREEIAQLEGDKIKIIANNTNELQSAVAATSPKVGEMRRNIDELRNSSEQTARAQGEMASQIDQLGNRVKHFFSLTNSVMLFRRAIKSAINTVKDLDAVMTETAVVTNFSVGDMWSQLPEYSKRASELGVSIHDAYKSATLYYQQGLKTNQVIEVSNATLRMARIAGLEASDATDRMTNALRGFNMEINETNADNVADVYSKLAAMSASNVDEISTAMTKVASLANNANMSFENTAAFLSQIIETTRESAETAGTALKTVIARFSEVKQLYSEGELTGTDSEGEEINVNKVAVALRAANVDLNEYLTGMKGLDDIFIELASKWDSLDQVQQRYIATMAAGSRQQSRFIALMSDYQRTQELTTAANNAAGASQEQYRKTLESLETKLNQLKNAWDNFLMGIANSDIIKGAVDALTWVIEAINKLTDKLPGATSGLGKLLVAILALKIGGTIFKALTAGAAAFSAAGRTAGLRFGKEFGKSLTGSATGVINKFIRSIAASKSLKTYKASLNDIKTASTHVATATQRLAAVQATENVSAKELYKAKDGLARAEKAEAAAKAQSVAAGEAAINTSKLNSAQKEIALGLYQKGIALETSELLAKTALTEAEREELAAVALKNGGKLTEEAITKLATEGKISEAAAERLLTASQSKGLKGLIMAIPLKIANWAATKVNTAAKTGETGATIGLTIANWLLKLSMIEILVVVLALIAAIALLVLAVIGIVNAIKAWKNRDISKQLEAQKEATQKATEAAQHAKEAYDALFEKHDEYDETQKKLEDLTKGTAEWKQALFEANQQVLDLLTTYPELAQYLGKGEDGQLTISDEGWDAVTEEYRQKAVSAQTNVLYQKQQTAQLQKNMDFMNLYDQAVEKQGFWQDVSDSSITGVIASSLTGMPVVTDSMMIDSIRHQENADQVDFEEQAESLLNSSLINDLLNANKADAADLWSTDMSTASGYSETLEAIAEQYGTSAEELYELKDAIGEYNTSLARQQAELEATATAIATGLISDENMEVEGSTDLASGFGRYMNSDAYKKEIQDLAKGMHESANGSGNLKDNKTAQGLASDLGVNLQGDDEDDLIRLYAASQGMSFKDAKDMELSHDEMYEALANYAQTNGYVDENGKRVEGAETRFNKFIDDFEKANDQTKTALRSASSKDTTNLTKKDIDELKSLNLDEAAKQMGRSKDEVAKYLGYDIGAFSKLSEEEQAIAREKFSDRFDEDGNINNFGLMSAAEMAEIQAELMAQQWQEKMDNYATSLTNMGVDRLGNVFDNLTLSTAEQLSNSLSKLSVTVGEDAAQGVTDLLDDTMKNFSDEEREHFIQSFENLDLTSIDSIRDFSDTLEDLDIPMTTEEMEQLENELINLTKATNAVALDKLEEKIKGINELVEDIEEREETSNKFTEEQYKKLVAAGVSESQFTQTDFDEYAYVGDSMMDLVIALNKNTEAILGDTAEQIKETADRSRIYQEALADENGNLKTERTINGSGGINATSNLEILKNIYEGNYGIGYHNFVEGATGDAGNQYRPTEGENRLVNYDELLGWFKDIGRISDEEYQEMWDNWTPEKLAEFAKAEYESYIGNNLSTAKANVANETEFNKEAATIDRNKQDTTYVVQDVLSSHGEKHDLTNDQEALTDYSNSLRNTAKELGVSQAKIDAFNKALDDNGGVLDENTAKILSNAIADKKAEANLNKKSKAIKDITDDYEDLTKVIPEDIQSIGDQLGLDDLEVGSKNFDFVKDNLDLINKAMNGDIESMKTLQSMLAQQMNLIVNVEDGTIDLDAMIAKLGELDQAAIDNINDLIKLGAYEVVTVTVEEAGDFEVPIIDRATGLITGTETRHFEQGQTMQILKPIDAPSIANATENKSGTYSGDNSGGGGSEEKYEPDYDILYNLIADLEAIQRTEESLIRELDKLKENPEATSTQIANKIGELLNTYKQDYALTTQKLAARQEQGQQIMADNVDLQQYATLDKTGKVQINYDAIYSVTDSTLGERIDDYISQLEEVGDEVIECNEALDDIEDKVEEFKNYGRDEYLEYEQRVMDSLVALYEDQIQELEDINDSINDANQKLLDGIRDSLDKQRQDRENEKTEEEIGDTQAKLAYLSMDTSGANQVQILDLQKQLDDQRQSYTDSLIDQKISELEDQNAVAQEQREQQIEIARNQLEEAQETGALWADVHAFMEGGKGSLSKTTADVLDSHGIKSVNSLVKWNDKYKAMSSEQQKQWTEEYKKQVAAANVYKSGGVDKKVNDTLSELKSLRTRADNGSTNKYLEQIRDKDWSVNVSVSGGGNDGSAGSYNYGYTPDSNPSPDPKKGANLANDFNKDGKVTYADYTKHLQDIKNQYAAAYNTIQQKGTDKNGYANWGYLLNGKWTDGFNRREGAYKALQTAEANAIAEWKKMESKFPKGGGCFVKGTPILTINNSIKPIEEIKIGEKVLAYNELTQSFVYKRVIKSYAHYNTPQVLIIVLSNGIILEATPGHPILTTEGWKSRDIENSLYEHNTVATLLNIGDTVVGINGNYTVLEISNKEINNHYITYNIEVEDCHTFVANGIVVHNAKAAYATGGLADYTGPAWLDGTKSKPEIVLNQRDTENFLRLREILASIMAPSNIGQKGADESLGTLEKLSSQNGDRLAQISDALHALKNAQTNLDIDIQIDKVEDEEDITELIERIKQEIYDDAMYRNANVLNLIR